jgi:hypothetical protein
LPFFKQIFKMYRILFLSAVALCAPAAFADPVPVQTVTASLISLPVEVALAGTLQAVNSFPVAFPQGGRVISVAVAEGDTADHFAWKNVREGGTGVDVIWVDEVSMLDIDLLCDLSHVSFRDPPPQWILSGDFNQ